MCGAVPQIGAVGGQVMHVATRLIGQHAATPAIASQQTIAHGVREADAKIAAAGVAPLQIKRALCGKCARRGADDLAHQLDREARLRRLQQIEIAEVGDLDPALAAFTQRNVEGVEDRAEPGRDDKISGFKQRFDVVRHRFDAGRGFGDDTHLRAACLRQTAHRVNHARIKQRVGQDQHVVPRADRKHAREVVSGLEPLCGGGAEPALTFRARRQPGVIHRTRTAGPVVTAVRMVNLVTEGNIALNRPSTTPRRPRP